MHADLQPTDVTGLSVWNPSSREFEFHPGPMFANVLLVDEVNRALPKAQSALLEGMAEQQVTVDGTAHPLPDPLSRHRDPKTRSNKREPARCPRRRLDRFMVGTWLGYPCLDEELSRSWTRSRYGRARERLRAVVGDRGARGGVQLPSRTSIWVPLLERWALELGPRHTRDAERGGGCSLPSAGGLALERMARAWALASGRSYVVPEDVEQLLRPVVGHRLVIAGDALLGADRGEQEIVADVLANCLEQMPPPEPGWREAERSPSAR